MSSKRFSGSALAIVLSICTVLVIALVVGGWTAFRKVEDHRHNRVPKAEQYEQRRLYEAWSSCKMDVDSDRREIERMEEDARQKSFQVYKSAEREKTIAECKDRIARSETRIREIEAACHERWQKHPERFGDLPGTANKYWREP